MRDCCNKYSIYEISVNKGKSGVVDQETQKAGSILWEEGLR